MYPPPCKYGRRAGRQRITPALARVPRARSTPHSTPCRHGQAHRAALCPPVRRACYEQGSVARHMKRAPWHPRARSAATCHAREHDDTPHPRPHVHMARGATHTACAARLRPVPRLQRPLPRAQRHDHFVSFVPASTDACGVGQGPVCTADAPQRTAAARRTVPHRALPLLPHPPSSLCVLSRPGTRARTAPRTKRDPGHPRVTSAATRGSKPMPPPPRPHVYMARGATHTACAARLRPVQRCAAPRSAHAHDVRYELEPWALGRGRGGVACACLAGESRRQASTYLWAGCGCDSPPSGASARCAGAVRCACGWPSCLFRAPSYNLNIWTSA